MSNNNEYYVMHGVALLPSSYDPNVESIKELPKEVRRELQKHGYRFTLVGHKGQKDAAMFVAYALCSPENNFSRKRGRKIATDRLKGFFEKMGASEYVVPIILSGENEYDIKKDIAHNDYLQNIVQDQVAYTFNYNNEDAYYNPDAFRIIF